MSDSLTEKALNGSGSGSSVRTSSCASERSAWEEAVSRVRVAAGRLRELIGGRLRLSAALSVAHRLSRPRRVSAPPRTRSPEALTRPCQVWKVDCSRPVLWCLRKNENGTSKTKVGLREGSPRAFDWYPFCRQYSTGSRFQVYRPITPTPNIGLSRTCITMRLDPIAQKTAGNKGMIVANFRPFEV